MLVETRLAKYSGKARAGAALKADENRMKEVESLIFAGLRDVSDKSLLVQLRLL